MKYLEARIRLPDRLLHPMAAFVRHEDAVRYEELLTWTVRAEAGVEYELFYVEADLEPYREAVAGVDSIVEHRVAPIDAESAHVWVCEETRPEVRAWRTAFEERQLVVVPPVRFDADATMGMTVVGEGPALRGLLSDVPDAVDVTVEAVGTYDRRGGTVVGDLTDRQLEALRTAVAAGYYEVPREATLAAVAEALGCAESSASVLLRRAERAVLSRVVGRYGGTVGKRERGGEADDGGAAGSGRTGGREGTAGAGRDGSGQ